MYIEIMLSAAAIAGVCLYYWNEILALGVKGKGVFIQWILDFKERDDTSNIPEADGINQAVLKVLTATFGVGTERGLLVFWIVSLLPASIFYTAGRRYLSFGILSGAMAMLMMLPITLLLVRLQKIRIRSSKEGKIMITELLDNYKINYFNMQSAIEVTAATIEEAPNSKRLLFNLSKGLNRASNSEDIKALLTDFSFAVGTSWSSILADNIAFALISGIRVEAAMGDLIKTLALAEEVEERAKRENNETDLILKYLVPVCYLLTYVGAIKYFGLTTAEFLHYQFATVTGLGWFVLIVVAYIVSLIGRFFLTQSKLDL